MVAFFILLIGDNMEHLILVFKGFMIGIGKIIPGVSGAIMAISLNVYERAINAIDNFFEDIKDNVKFLLPLGFGILIGIVLFSKVIINLLNRYYLPTMLFFIGLIIGGNNNIKKQIKLNKSNSIFIIMIIFSILLLSKINVGKNNQYNLIIVIGLGFVEAITMIIPGISGTAVLMVLGYYNLVIESFANFNLNILIPFGIGLTIGILIITKIINFLFNNYRHKTYVVIYGLSITSIILMFIITFKNNYSFFDIIVSLILLVIGYNITKIMEK